MVRANGDVKDMTTGQAARVAGVAPRTLSKWIDGGLLRGYKVPGSQDRRVRPSDFAEFLRAHGMGHRIPFMGGGFTRVLFVGFPDAMREALSVGPYEPTFAPAGFAGGIAMADARPAVVVVDSAIGRIDARQVAEASRGLGAKTVVLGDHVDGFDASGDSADSLPSLVRSVLTMEA